MNSQAFLLMLLVLIELQLGILQKKVFVDAAKWKSRGAKRRNELRNLVLNKSPYKGKYFLQLLASTRSESAKRRSSVALHCKLRGKNRPSVRFSWEKDGLPLVASSRRFIKTRMRSERLKIKQLRIIDSGKYRCSATINGRKIRSKSVKIFVPGTNDPENGFEDRSQPLLQDRCELYRGSVCLDHMNSQRLVFMRAGEDQDEIEKRLAKNINHMGKLTSPECFPDVLRVSCISLFPPCRVVNETSVPLLMCRESCRRLSESHCSKGFRLLPDLKIIQTVDDCSMFPETDSNQPCARVSMPGFHFKNRKCKRDFRLKEKSTTALNNRLDDVKDETLVCKNVKWRPMSKGVRLLTQLLLHSDDVTVNGRFAMASNGAYCISLPVKISSLIRSRIEFSKIIPLPGLKEIAHDKTVRGFSMTLDRQGNVKRLLFPIGHLQQYGIDKEVSIPNVTIYVQKDTLSTAFIGEGMFDLCGTKFQMRIEQTKEEETLLAGHSPHPVDLSTVELAFGLRQPTADLLHVMKNFKILKLRLINPKLNIYWKEKIQRTMRFSGQAYNSAWGNEKVNVEFVLGKGQSFWAAAVTTAKQSFKEIFGIFADWKHVRLAKLLDMALDIDEVGFILATKDVAIPSHPSLSFQHEPAKTMARESISHGLTLEAKANVRENCRRNENRSFICQLVQFAAGLKASTNIQIKSHLAGFFLSIEFHPDGSIPRYSSKFLSKLRQTWGKINPFARVPSSNVEIVESDDQSWKFLPRYAGLVWLRKLQVHVDFVDSIDLFDSRIVHISADVVHSNTRYTYKISNVGLSYCLRMLDSITEILKRCRST